MKYKTTIGLEIHIELNTKSKMFCGCINPASLVDDIADRKPNSFCCPICMGFPGTLPVVNKQAIEYCVMAGLALNCKIQKKSKFDRKHYFYPDLPKGYQISQYDMPFCKNGYLKINNQKIRINRIHLEEDAGKLIHLPNSNVSLVDFNRSSAPLIEIVTEPDITSPKMAKDFVQELRSIIRNLRISDVNMEKGHLRCDANIDISNKNKKSPIIEIKNLNSFRFIEKALLYEEKRLFETCNQWPSKKTKITRGFDSKNNQTYPQREKEEASDYRYFPEPDLPMVVLSNKDIKKIKNKMPKSQAEISLQYQRNGLSENQIKHLLSDIKLKNYFDKVAKKTKNYQKIYSLVSVELLGIAKKTQKSIDELINPDEVADLIILSEKKTLSSSMIKKILLEITKSSKKPSEIYQNFSSKTFDIEKIISEIFSENNKAIQDYKKGNKNVLGFLVGQVMKKTQGKVDPNIIRIKIQERIKDV
jgi:aspartyl-tRNA(Asn)/glutamyl-tRNA(Gln) amidotransferase subunit B